MFACRTATAKPMATNRIEIPYAGEATASRPNCDGTASGIVRSPYPNSTAATPNKTHGSHHRVVGNACRRQPDRCVGLLVDCDDGRHDARTAFR